MLAWSVYYAVSKIMVDATGSAYLAGFLLRLATLFFLTLQLVLDGNFARLFSQGKAVGIVIVLLGAAVILLRSKINREIKN